MIISSDLFKHILEVPMQQGADELRVVSGYATPAMVSRHIHLARENELNVKIRLLVGMCPSDGISQNNHRGFKGLVGGEFHGAFECSYIFNRPSVHSKVYAWLRNGKPVCGFVGSANYTQNAFSKNQMEAMVPCVADTAFNYFQSLTENSIYCTYNEVEGLINIYQNRATQKQFAESGGLPNHLVGLSSVKISLLTKYGVVPARSGLNWGQRPEAGRDPNQSYLSLRAEVYKTDFFPERAVHFTVLTDDGKTIICSRAQDEGKGIHTPHNNALLGEYFRNRLGLASGAPVTKADLDSYGRTDVTFYKVDDETYYMDFSQ